MSVDLSKYNLNDITEFTAASGEVAESVADSLGENFSRSEGEAVFVNVKAISPFVAVAAQNALVLMLSGDQQTALELVKLGTAVNSVLDEAKVRESSV
jgi:hypothetical protein